MDSVAEFAEQFATEIQRFNKLVTKDVPVDDIALRELCSFLSLLLDHGERCPDAHSDTDIEAPDIDRKQIEKMVCRRFPDFGFYNSSTPENIPVDSAQIEVNDAIDDVCDIYCDLNQSLWYIENGEPSLCLWSAKLLFGHWGRHAINLKSYLHKHIHEW